jgi:lipopolysaccharide biosynthesis glycosyltransferase
LKAASLKIVTAIDAAYLPGLVALHNSMLRNSPQTPLACVVYGDERLAETVRSRGIEVLHNPQIEARLPTTDIYPVGNPAMWCRIMLPHWFDCDTVWMDADQIVLKSLAPLSGIDCGLAPCAAVESTTISHHVQGLPRQDDTPALYSGLILMRREAWIAQKVTERCLELMRTSALTFRFVVQSVLSMVLHGNFHRLHPRWQRFGNRHHQAIPGDACVVHWHGHSRNPWMCAMANNDLWQQYA